ncbi:hypothetical protein TNCV_4837761 [Trichonephila clavipes]|nr:hypothetical protein TNCV_4837761 [Trichonephila clavipes]
MSSRGSRSSFLMLSFLTPGSPGPTLSVFLSSLACRLIRAWDLLRCIMRLSSTNKLSSEMREKRKTHSGQHSFQLSDSKVGGVGTGVRILDHPFKQLSPPEIRDTERTSSPFVGVLSQQLEKGERVHHSLLIGIEK